MSRDFILVFGGGMVSLVTTLVVLFIADFMNRRGEAKRHIAPLPPPPETIMVQVTTTKGESEGPGSSDSGQSQSSVVETIIVTTDEASPSQISQ